MFSSYPYFYEIRLFKILQAYLPLAQRPKPDESKASDVGGKTSSLKKSDGEKEKGDGQQQKEYAHDMVRTDAKSQKLEKFFFKLDAGQETMEGQPGPGSQNKEDAGLVIVLKGIPADNYFFSLSCCWL